MCDHGTYEHVQSVMMGLLSRQVNSILLSAGVQNETCCGNKMRQRFGGGIREGDSLSGLGLERPGRAYWRGRGRVRYAWRPATMRTGVRSPLPPLARPRQ